MPISDTLRRLPPAGPRGLFVGVAAVLVLGVLVTLAFQLAQAQNAASETIEERFEEKARISATLTQSVFSALGGASGGDLQRRYGGAVLGLEGRLRRQLPESHAPYAAILDARGRTLAAAGRPPRRLALAGAPIKVPILSDVSGKGRARVIEYAIPFGPKGRRRAIVQPVPLALMARFLKDYLQRLHQVDGAGLALADSKGVVLTRRGRVGIAGPTRPERIATRARVPGTPWSLRLEAPRDRVFASVNHLRWLPWLLLAALTIAAIVGIALFRRVLASARRQREAGAAVHESRDQLRNLVDALEEGVALHHADGRTELLNGSAREMMHTAEDGVLKELPPGWELLDEAGSPIEEGATPVERVLSSGEPCTQVIAVQRADGSRRWLNVRARPLVRPEEDRPYAVVASWTDVSEQREMELHLTELAEREPLTGLWNRRRFEEDLGRQLSRCRRYDEHAALLLIDIDGFKQVNDTLGHLAGDEVLRALADALRQRLRASDSAARIGGDEFAVIMLGVGEAEAREMAADVAVRLTAFVHGELDSRRDLTLSIGVALLDGRTQGIDEAFAAADQAMYADKRRAREAARATGADALAPGLASIEPLPSRPDPHLSSLRALVTAVQARDSYTAGHSRQVVTLARAVGRRLGLGEAETAQVEGAALLHDLGKIAVPDAILRKSGPLSEHEWELMRQHPVVGAQMVASIAELEHLAPAIRAEHERWDGKGYPDGLAGEAIPLASRITFVCDAYHAMTSDRPYRRALSHQEAMEEIEQESGRQFCPSAAAALLEVLRAQDEQIRRAAAEREPQVAV